MRMLTTFLLIDSVKKGGPGSGPHPVGSSLRASQEAKLAGKKAAASGKAKDYRAAAAAHQRASDFHRAESRGADFHSVKADIHAGQAKRFTLGAEYAERFGENPAPYLFGKRT